MKPGCCALLAFSLYTAVAAADDRRLYGDASVQSAVEKLIIKKKYPPHSLGIAVQEVERGVIPVACNADSLFNPASVTKLITAAIACERLGPDRLLSTQVFVDTAAEFSTAVTVRNCYIRGRGDPGFTAERLWLFVEHLYHLGIRKITGDLFLDDFFFDSSVVGPGFDEDTSSRAYQPPISALAMNFNAVAVHCRPGSRVKQPVVVDLFPEIKGVRILPLAATVPPGRKNRLDISTSFDSGATLVTVKGAMGIDERGNYTYRKLWQTWEAFGNALVPLLARRGILFQGKIIHAKVPDNLAGKPPFYEFIAEPLSESIACMFKYSSNFTAEMLFKALSARSDTTIQGSWERSAAFTGSWWKERGLPETPIIKNGSGMGDLNRISPAQVTALLGYAWQQKAWFPDYCAALSNAGLDGTLKDRFVNSRLKGMVRAKTGTLNALRVNTLAGYLLLPESPPYAFAIFCSRTGHTQFEDWTMQEQILEIIAAGAPKR
ncbi:MAG: D-alanyl-D-alanine carboxypeptidase/D-alanyl-D-alanine-endopeptidase [Chitinispirillaceae bacterium]|nr:D-alanyl-D-alanine carboxypeptidase/D-alanyl-D-alanine-endopeptidase [Chitinispirillaceae bacterium]